MGYPSKFNTWIPETYIKNIESLKSNAQKVELLKNLPNLTYILDKTEDGFILQFNNENVQEMSTKDLKNILFSNFI